MVHTYLGETINFHITYKKKKSVRLFVDSYGNVEVQAPKGTPVEYLVQLLEEKWDWIQTTRKEMAERARGPQEKGLRSRRRLFVFREYVSDTDFPRCKH